MTKYIGWDVGIKNLSYCILDDTFNIIDWGIINLMDEPSVCCTINSKGNVCGKKSFYIDKTKNVINTRDTYCKIHGKKMENVIEIGYCFYCSKKSKYIVDNEQHVCKVHSKNKENSQLILETNASKLDLNILGRNMIDKLDNNPSFLDVSFVVIENQPVLKNPKMKSIQMMLFTYFLIRNNTINVNLVSAGSKLKFNIKNEFNEKIEKLTNKYTKRKKLAIEYCKHFIKEDTTKFNFFNTFKKNDDLADAYLLVRKFMIK